MRFLLFLVLLGASFLAKGQGFEKTYYRNAELELLALKPAGRLFKINNDQMQQVTVSAYSASNGLPYWYRRVETEVCLTGDCRPIDVGIFWDCMGEFAGLEVFKEPLTKTDHSNFAPWDYSRLMSILSDDWSPLREYTLSELTEEKKEDGVDGVSGATKHEIAEAAVADAVYTTHTLWHLIHVGEKEQLAELTAQLLPQNGMLEKLIQADKKKYHSFLLDMFGQGHIQQNEVIETLLFEGLSETADPTVKTSALHALGRVDLTAQRVQDRLAETYKIKQQPEKVEILAGLGPVKELSGLWYTTLSDDLSPENPWMAVKIIQILKNNRFQSKKVIQIINQLAESPIPIVRNAVQEFRTVQKK